MAFQVSPGVNVSEVDLTTVIPAVSTSIGGLAGLFRWGPTSKRVLVSSEDQLFQQFDKPSTINQNDWYTAASFLAYANALWVVRVDNNANNAVSDGVTTNSTTQVLNDDDYATNHSSGISGVGNFVAKYPGNFGNNIKFSICQSANAFSSTLAANLEFQASNTTIRTVGANASLTTIDLTSVVANGDIIFLQSSAINLGSGLKVSNVTSSTLTVETAPTRAQLGVTDDTTLAFANSATKAATRRWEYYNFVSDAPGTTPYVASRNGANDEFHMVVVDTSGRVSEPQGGQAGTVLEVWEGISRASVARAEDGTELYYKDVINNRSAYLWWAGHPASMTNAGADGVNDTFSVTSDKVLSRTLSGGTDGDTVTDADYVNGYDEFRNAEEVDVSILMGSDRSATVLNHIIDNICEVRKDCVLTCSPESGDVVGNSTYLGKEAEDSIEFRNTLRSTSYAVMDSGYKYTFDKYRNNNRYVPLNGDVAGLMARTDQIRDPWYSPAGFNRGNVKNVIRLAYNPDKASRDELYKAGINPVVTFPGQGTVLFGDKTLLARPSAFDRINVRRLFIVLEKAISTAAKFSLFEFNDAFTRAQFRNLVEPFLRDVQGRRGITDFRVVCDETNNTPEIIDRNEFVGDIYIKPARSINFIQLNFVAVRSGVDFDEIVGQF